MKRNRLKRSFGLLILFLVSGIVMASPSFALDVDLAAVEATWTPPGSATPVTMWGFVPDAGSCPGAPPAWDVGPEISVTAGDVLNINLRNCLAVPVSIVIPGQMAAMTPTWTDDATGNRTSASQRVRSFTHETAPSAVGVYTWNPVRAGTYLYESGTHQALQVPMGLYGALKVDVAPGMAYAGVPYNNEVVLLYSEVDPSLHDPPTVANPRNYNPSYFLVNGEPFVSGSTAPVPIGAAGQRTIVRLLSAALRDTVPTINGAHWDIVAEDGNPYPYPRSQYSALMSAGKTRDAILTPTEGGSFWVYDRRLSLTNGADSPGGLLTSLQATLLPPGILGTYNNGTWTLDSNGNAVLDPGVDTTFNFGLQPGDIPVTGDWDGNGITTAGIFRGGTWYLDLNGNGLWDGQPTDSRFNFGGQPGDIPVAGDWNGNGVTTAGIFRGGTWFLDVNGNGLWDGQPTDSRFNFGGQPGDIPVTGDWNGTGTDRAGIFRGGTWYLDQNGNGLWDGQPTDLKINRFGGQPGDIPVTGDWDGTGADRAGIFRDGTWYLDMNGNGLWDRQPTDLKLTFGAAGDTPVTLGP